MGQILTWLGAQVRFEDNAVRVQAKKIKGTGEYDLIRKMRGSICVMGPLLARLKKATVSLPGGCVIGARPINLHLKGFQALAPKARFQAATSRPALGACSAQLCFWVAAPARPCWAPPMS